MSHFPAWAPRGLENAAPIDLSVLIENLYRGFAGAIKLGESCYLGLRTFRPFSQLGEAIL